MCNNGNINPKWHCKSYRKNYITLTLKLCGKSSFLYEKAVKIQETFFPEYDLKELFAVDNANNHEAKTG